MTQEISQIWVYLSASPLLGLTITLLAYQAAFALYSRSGNNPLANPVLIAVFILVLFLMLTATSYETYFSGVALAIPLYTQFRRVRSMLLPVLAGLIAGSLTAIVSAVLVARLLGASASTQFSLAPKSVTTPIAMGIAERIGGIPSLTAVLVIVTGILGAVGARFVFDAMKVRDPAIRGFAIGIASHGIGTARAFQVNEQSGAFAALAMGMNGALTALLVPWITTYLINIG